MGKTKNEMCLLWFPEIVHCIGLVLCVIWGRAFPSRAETRRGEDRGTTSIDICWMKEESIRFCSHPESIMAERVMD